MTARAVDYDALTSDLLTEQGGARLDSALQQIFFNSFKIAVSQSAAINIEADAISIAQTAAIKIEAKGPAVQTGQATLESRLGGLSKTAVANLEARGFISAATAQVRIEAKGAASIPSTAVLRVETFFRRHSSSPTPRWYVESKGLPSIQAQLYIESGQIAQTSTASLPIASTEDPAASAAMNIECGPHNVAQSAAMQIEERFGIATRRWFPLEEYGDIRSTGGATLVIEARGIPQGIAPVPLESTHRVVQTAQIPVELPFVRVPKLGVVDVEARGFTQTTAAIPVEVEKASVIVPQPAGATGVLVIVRTATESLVIAEALPLSESLTD